MRALAGQRGWFAAGAAAVILGVASTAALATVAGAPTVPARSGDAVGETCRPARPAGAVVDVDLTDMGAMMNGPRHPGAMMNGDARWWRRMPMEGMMRLSADRDRVRAGRVTFVASDTGALTHEMIVLPLPAGQSVGERPIGDSGKVDETGSLGEASRSCAPGTGKGITPGTAGWTTVTLKPGRYELICNLPGHYAAGMYTELDVTR